METRINLDDGRSYVVTHDEGKDLRELQYRMPLREVTEEGLILAMASEIEKLRTRVAELHAALGVKVQQDQASVIVTNLPLGDWSGVCEVSFNAGAGRYQVRSSNGALLAHGNSRNGLKKHVDKNPGATAWGRRKSWTKSGEYVWCRITARS